MRDVGIVMSGDAAREGVLNLDKPGFFSCFPYIHSNCLVSTFFLFSCVKGIGVSVAFVFVWYISSFIPFSSSLSALISLFLVRKSITNRYCGKTNFFCF